MNTAKQVADLIAQMKAEGKPNVEIAWNAALACEGWPYVFGAWGAECTVAERKKRYRDDHPTIRSACKAYDGGSCSGCKWYPNGERVRCFDCRGFTDWVLKNAGVIDLEGEGATGQWNSVNNWDDKGTIDTMPGNTLVCLFVRKDGRMQHTGLGYNNETVECSSGVQHFTSRKSKWTHWAKPKGSGAVPIPPSPGPTPEPTPSRPTLRRGSKGEAVVELQTILHKLGYDLGGCGIDGDYGRMTMSAVMNFQSDHGLTRDGVCGAKTWAAILASSDSLRPVTDPLYTVHISHCTTYQAEALLRQYPGAYKTAEGSD